MTALMDNELPPRTSAAVCKHIRTVTSSGWLREDGLWDVEAELKDVKAYEYVLPTGARPPGTPVHHMKLRVTINDEFEIVDAVVVMLAIPFPNYCRSITSNYRKLVGLNLKRGFRKDVAERFPPVERCTHMSELTQSLPTTAIQTLYGEKGLHGGNADNRPGPLNGCHVWDSSSPMVKEYFPRWHTPAGGT